MSPSNGQPAVARKPGFVPTPHVRTLLCGAAILLVCILAYAPVLRGKFLWDDLYLVGQNPFFKSPRFVFEVFRHYLFLDSFSLYYRPVQNLTYMADYAIWNRNEFGYHLSNILFHAASAFLLFLVLRDILRRIAAEISPGFREGAAFCIGLLWAVHPIHNAAVAYVSGRADSIAMMLALGAWLLFFEDVEGNRGWQRIAALGFAAICVLLALCAKEIAFIWIALFALYLFGFEKNISLRGKFATVAALLAIFGVYLWLRHLPGPRAPQQGVQYPPFAERIVLMLRALGDYTSLIFYPGHLHMERSVWSAADYKNLAAWQLDLRAEYLSLIGLLTIAAFCFACACKLPGRRVRIFGVAWFVLGFLPISNLFPLNAQVAEHWIYMASAGYLLMLAGWACAIPPRWHRALVAVVPVAVLALGVRTAFRAAEWADPETLFRQTIADGGFPERVSLNLAQVLTEKGKLTEAEAVLRTTVRDFPDYPPARIQLGTNLVAQGRKAEAEQYLNVAAKTADLLAATTPQSWHAALNLAGIRLAAHQPEAALEILNDAVQRYPGVWDLEQYRAEILQSTQGPQRALLPVQAYADAHWWHIESHLLLAKLRAECGDYDGALTACADAATLDIHSAAPYEQAARADVMERNFSQALEDQSTAIARGPATPNQYMMLAAILNEMNQPEQALAAKRMAEILRVDVNVSADRSAL